MRIAEFLTWFIRRNRDICDWIEESLPNRFTRSLLNAHQLGTVAEIMSRRPPTWVLDMGGGRNTPFVRFLPTRGLCTVVACDILEGEIRNNDTVDFRIVGDICGTLPLRAGSMDVVTTHSVLEHLLDPRAAINEVYRVLAANGVCIHVFPARFSLFSMLNRIIPGKIARRLLFTFFPEWVGHCGFPAFYRHCDARAMLKDHTDAGFVIRKVEYRYYQSIYFKFFLPLYLISLAYDLTTYLLDWPLLACQIFLVAEKRATVERERHQQAQGVAA